VTLKVISERYLGDESARLRFFARSPRSGVAKQVYSLAQEQNDPALMIGAYSALATTLCFLGDFEPARQYAMHGLEIWRSGKVPSQIEQVTAPSVACLYVGATYEWHLGEIASCQVNMAEAISLRPAKTWGVRRRYPPVLNDARYTGPVAR
jgi:hypothetical protein